MNETEYMLQGGVDLHTHCGPDFYDRSVDQIELAENAKREKMAAVVLKNHFCPTFFAARQSAKKVPGIRVFGGLVLNKSVRPITRFLPRVSSGSLRGFSKMEAPRKKSS